MPETPRQRTRSPRSMLTLGGLHRVPLPDLTVTADTGATLTIVRPVTSAITTPIRRILTARSPSLRSRLGRREGLAGFTSGDLPCRAPLGYRCDMAPDEREELTPALSEARARRATLHDALVDLEVAISSPASGRIPEWTASSPRR